MLILASASPRRRELLTRMGAAEFKVVPAHADEHVEGVLEPEALVSILSRRKARAVEAGPEDVILAADTLVALGGTVLGKPRDAEDAARMLRLLSGRTHTVSTGVTLRRGARVVTHVEVTEVDFRPLTEEEIAWYVATGEPMDKAGAYGVQGLASRFIPRIRGDYYNVMGLPVCALGLLLREFGVG